MLAAWKLGGVFVPLNPMYRPREIALLLADAQPKVLVAEPHLLSEVYDNIPEGGERPGLVLGADINIYGALDPRVGGPLPPASAPTRTSRHLLNATLIRRGRSPKLGRMTWLP